MMWAVIHAIHMKCLAVLPYEHIEDNTIGNTADSCYFKNG